MSAAPRTLEDWLAWQERLNPRLIDLGLERLRPVAARMGLDRWSTPLITVAGTNGKGSTVAYLEALALACGVLPGCYVSPWLLRYNESVRIGGHEVDDQVLLDAFARVEAARQDVLLTAFEYRTLAAVDVIRSSGAGLAVLEVGLGGRLDAVNLFDATVAVITSLGLDHREWLGDTLASVAREKAGILRRGRPVVCADPACTALLEPLVGAHGALPWLGGREVQITRENASWSLRWGERRLDALPAPLLDGEHQYLNAAAALIAFDLSEVGALDRERAGKALASSRIRGRLERLPGPRERRVDVAHNPQAASVLAHWLSARFAQARVRAVCAMYVDKDHRATLRALAPGVSRWYLADLPPPRGATASELAAALSEIAPAASVRCFASVEQAWRAASAIDADGDGRDADLLLAFGSFETARRVLRLESTAGSRET